MGDKMLGLVYWNLICVFYASVLENNIYSLEKLLGNILILRKNAGKTFAESFNNPVMLRYVHANN